MEHIWSVLCQRPIIETETNRVSLIDTVDTVSFEANEQHIDALPIRLHLISSWWRTKLETPEMGRGKTQIVYSQDERILRELEFSVDLVNAPRARVLGTFEGFPFVGNGVYRLVVQIFDETQSNWETVARVPVEITWIKS